MLCEKALSRHASEVERAFELAEQSGLVLSEGFSGGITRRRGSWPSSSPRGQSGRLRKVRAAFSFQLAAVHGAEDARFDPELDGGALMDVGCYCISAIRGEAALLLGRDDALGQARVIESLYRSAEAGAPVEV